MLCTHGPASMQGRKKEDLRRPRWQDEVRLLGRSRREPAEGEVELELIWGCQDRKGMHRVSEQFHREMTYSFRPHLLLILEC